MSHSFGNPWTVARQAPLSMGFPRHEYWSGLPFPFPRDLPHPEIELGSPALQILYRWATGVSKSRTGLSEWTELSQLGSLFCIYRCMILILKAVSFYFVLFVFPFQPEKIYKMFTLIWRKSVLKIEDCSFQSCWRHNREAQNTPTFPRIRFSASYL